MSNVPDLMTMRQAREYAQVSKWTLQSWERQGLRVVRRGGVVRIYRADLDAFLRGETAPGVAMLSSPRATALPPEQLR